MFATYIFLPLADSVAVLYTGPLMIVVLSGVVLGERMGLSRVVAVALGFCGVVVMVAEHLGEGHGARGVIGVATGLGGALFVAIAMIQTRRLSFTEHTGAIVFYFQLVASLSGLAFCLAGALWPATAPFAGYMTTQGWVWPPPKDCAFMFAAGLCGGLGQILMTSSYRYADASIVACFEYVSMIWVVTLGILVFGEYPSLYVVAGAGIVIAAGVLLIFGERGKQARNSRT
jgi:drug/metabolite transporter (DMT)-like permease